MDRKYIDKDGKTHIDDQGIYDADGFLRRMPKEYWKDDGTVSSVSFGPEGLSFCLESFITPVSFHNEYPDQGLIRLGIGQMRHDGEVIEWDPQNGNKKSDLAHCLSWGKKSKTKKKRWKNLAQVLYTI